MKSECEELLRIVRSLGDDEPWPAYVRARADQHLLTCKACWSELAVWVARDEALLEKRMQKDLESVDWTTEWKKTSAAVSRPGQEKGASARVIRFPRWWIAAGLAAAACVALVVFWPNGSTQSRYIIAATSTVATDTMGSPDAFYRITVELQRPAFVRLAARDCNGVVALATKGVSTDSEEAVTGVWQGSLNATSLDDPNCRRSHAFVIAGPSRLPDELEVLVQTPSDATADRLAEALERAKHEIEERFGSEVRIIPLPPTP